MAAGTSVGICHTHLATIFTYAIVFCLRLEISALRTLVLLIFVFNTYDRFAAFPSSICGHKLSSHLAPVLTGDIVWTMGSAVTQPYDFSNFLYSICSAKIRQRD